MKVSAYLPGANEKVVDVVDDYVLIENHNTTPSYRHQNISTHENKLKAMYLIVILEDL